MLIFIPLNIGFLKGVYANFSHILSFFISLENKTFRFYFIFLCDAVLLENFSLIEFASLFICAGPTKILLNQLLCFFFRWIKLRPTIRFIIHLPIWTQLEEKKFISTFYSQIFFIYILIYILYIYLYIFKLCSNKTYCKNKILSPPDPNATNRIIVIFPEYTGTGKCTLSH